MAREDRYHPNDRHANGDSRAAFQRDRDRILYSYAFRRLAGVTQVVHSGEGHLFHNRLTHSLKVAQFGRRVAERLIAADAPGVAGAGIDPDVVESACLAHDLGHPPFGHVAELELNEQLTNAKVADGFEGNAQSFRILNRLAIRQTQYRGLNLTRATLNATLKYPWGYEPGGDRQRKWGYYISEKPVFEWAHQPNPHDGVRSLEAELMDWADDVTYAVHDVEDFYRAGIVPLDRILSGALERDRFLDRAKKEGVDPTKAEALLSELGDAAPDEVKGPFDGSTAQRAALNSFSAVLITRYNTAVSIDDGKLKIVPEAKDEVKVLKTLMKVYVFNNPALVAQQYGQRSIVRHLFEVLFDAVQRKSDTSGLVPMSYRDLVKEVDDQGLKDLDDKRERARIVADLVSQMTEQQAISFHQRLTGTASGSIIDRIVR